MTMTAKINESLPKSEPGLAQLLRDETRQEHERAESRSFIADLMGGALDVEAYYWLARQHHAIYATLEVVSRDISADHPVRALMLPELNRTAPLEADLDRLLGSGWRDLPTLSATQRYVARLEEVAATATGYAAHAYTRYLGDLSGGQVVRTMLSRHYGLEPDVLTFYAFPGKAKELKDRYRALLDDIPFTTEQKAQVLSEARLAFELNSGLFEDLARYRSLAA